MKTKNKALLTLALVVAAVAAPVQKAEARGFRHHGGFHHCHGGWGRGGHHFWGGFAGGVVGGLVGGFVRPYGTYYHSPVVVSTPTYYTPSVVTTPAVTYSTPTVVSQPAPIIQPQPQTIVKETIKEAPAPKAQPTFPKLNPGESMTVKPDGTIIITRQEKVPVFIRVQENIRE